jgi:STE24 endopeptidase
MPVIIGFLLFSFVYNPVESVLGLCMNILSRRKEFEADAFAAKLGYGKELKDGLIKIHVENMGNLNPDWLYSLVHYSHPPLIERLNAITNTKKTD